jgi:hypothetical protein
MQLSVLLSVYELVRAEPNRFLLLPGHESAFEHVVGSGNGYLIVEKEGSPAEVASQTNPRG